MRVHTSVEYGTLSDAARAAGVMLTASRHGSRTHDHAWEIRLTDGAGRARTNSGKHGAGHDVAATWDEWGIFLARVFDVDPDTRVGSVAYPVYTDADAFHIATDWRYETLTPGAQHVRHTWRSAGVPREQACKCGAVRRWAA